MAQATYDLVVVGGGPAGYTGAIRAAQLGMRVALCEQEARLGGTCLRVGCIPSKALLESSARYEEAKSHLGPHGILVGEVKLDLTRMHARKDGVVSTLADGVAGLLRKHKIDRVLGHAQLTGQADDATQLAVKAAAGGEARALSAKHVLLAPGSTEVAMRNVPVNGSSVVSSTEALAFETVPKTMAVIGGGAIGLELGSVWRRLGAEVTVLEYAERILPAMDEELALAAHKVFVKQGLKIRCKTKVESVEATATGARVHLANEEPLEVERVLVAVGRRPNTDELGLETCGVARDERNRIQIDAHFATTAAGIYAVGDAVVGPMLAHKAEEEAVACVERLATGYGHVNYGAIASIVYTEPELASVGAAEHELKAQQIPYKKGNFPFAANGRARAMAATDGFVKILAHADTDRILGAHIMGARAGDLLQEVATAINFAATSEDIARSCHAHPTLAEAVREAALAVDKRTLNL